MRDHEALNEQAVWAEHSDILPQCPRPGVGNPTSAGRGLVASEQRAQLVNAVPVAPPSSACSGLVLCSALARPAGVEPKRPDAGAVFAVTPSESNALLSYRALSAPSAL